jgi:hypothetical protein
MRDPSDDVFPMIAPFGSIVLGRSVLEEEIHVIDEMRAHLFVAPTDHGLLHDSNRYPPKAIIGLTFRHSTGQFLRPEEFSGGLNCSYRSSDPSGRSRFDLARQRIGAYSVKRGLLLILTGYNDRRWDRQITYDRFATLKKGGAF